MFAEPHQFSPHGFEQQPLVSTGTSKLDVDNFLQTAKTQQRKFFIASTVLTLFTLAYGGYLFSQFPRHLLQPHSTFNPIGGQCTPSAFPAWFFTVTHVMMILIPLICWIDSLKQFLSPAATQDGSVLVFKPYFVRNTTDQNFTAPDTFLQRIRSRAFAAIQIATAAATIFSLVGLTGTLAIAPSTLCTDNLNPLRYAYIAGLGLFGATFVGVLTYMIVQHKKQLMSSIGSTNTLDHYHPL